MLKNSLKLVSVMALVAGCQSMSSRSSGPSSPQTGQPAPVEVPPTSSNVGQVPAAPTTDKVQMAIILGPGGIRSFAHIGFLQELAKAKIPVAAVAGIEMGALVGAIFSEKAQIFDVEWQMMKLKEDEFIKRQLITSNLKPGDMESLKGFMQTALGDVKGEETKIPFACPAFNLLKRQTYMMNKGPLASFLPYCMPFPPMFRPHHKNVAGVNSLMKTIQFLKGRGINYFVYVSLLDDINGAFFENAESEANVSWNFVAQSLENQMQGANYVVRIPLSGYYLTDFGRRKEILQKGQLEGQRAAQEIQRALGL